VTAAGTFTRADGRPRCSCVSGRLAVVPAGDRLAAVKGQIGGIHSTGGLRDLNM
jgi:hypothetical protein